MKVKINITETDYVSISEYLENGSDSSEETLKEIYFLIHKLDKKYQLKKYKNDIKKINTNLG